MIDKKQLNTRAAYSYLMTDLTKCEFFTTDPNSEWMCYKVHIFTPAGVLKLDTGASDFKEWSRTKKETVHIIKWYLKNPCRVGPYEPWPLQDIIDNWKRHGLWTSRVLEKKLVELWDGSQQAKTSHLSTQFPYLLRMQLMARRHRPNVGLSPNTSSLI
jgi:hypothetical protein